MYQRKARQVWEILRKAAIDWIDHDAFAQAAAISFFTLFSLAPLLVIAVAVAGQVFGRQEVRAEIVQQFTELMGREGGEYIGTIIDKASDPTRGITASLLGLGTLLVGASGAFAQLRAALNLIWCVKPRRGLGVWRFVRNRIISFALAVGVAFLLLMSLVISAMLAALHRWAGEAIPGEDQMLRVGNFLLSFGVISVLFAGMFKVLPDAKIGWRETLIGALVTAGLFTVGKFLIGLYLGQSSPASIYGAAGSLAIVLFWMYYSSLIFLFGAEITHEHAVSLGKRNPPKKDAEEAPDTKKAMPARA